MSENLPNWFTKKYDDTILSLAQQRERRLAGRTSGGGVFIGDSIFFPRMGAVEMYDSPRFAMLALANAQQDMIEVKAKPKFVALGVWDPDKPKLSINLAAEYGRATVMAGNRAEDNMIVKALNDVAANGITTAPDADGNTTNETIVTLGDYNTVADLDTFAQGISLLGTQEKFDGEEISVVLPFKVKTNNSLDPYMALKNVNNNLPWDNISWSTHERLKRQDGALINKTTAIDGTTTGVDMFLFCRSSVSSDYNNQMTTIQERIGGALTDMIGRWFQAGAVGKEAAGIIRIKSKYDFNLARKALPFIDGD